MTRAVPIALSLSCACALLWASVAVAQNLEDVPEQMRGVDIEDKRGAQVSTDLRFVDHEGAEVALSDLLGGQKPVLLTMNYYQCRMLCTEQLNGLVKSLRLLDWTAGDQFRMVTVSIDHHEGPKLAASKRKSYLFELGRDEADWHFLTGRKESIAALAAQVGFQFKYDKETGQYAHPPAIMFLSPDGRVMQYLFGKEFSARTLKFALMDASEGKTATVLERLAWTCFHYDEQSGEYTPYAMGIMRLGGALTALILAGVLAFFWRRERSLRRAEQLT